MALVRTGLFGLLIVFGGTAGAANVAIVQGGFYTTDLRNRLIGAGESVTEISSYSAGSLAAFDAVIHYGNSFVDFAALETYVTDGGTLVETPWFWSNFAPTPALQVVTNGESGFDYVAPYPGVNVLNAADPLLTGVLFPAAGGALQIGRTRGNSFVAGVNQVATWVDDGTAMIGWKSQGAGKVVAINLHVITSDTAYYIINESWATQLLVNAVTLLSHCGDGVLDAGEQCDDGNNAAGDGCRQCRVEPCYTCSGEPSTCSLLPEGSDCDDGLFCNGTDTCSAGACTIHTGDTCIGGAECSNLCNEANDTCFASAGTLCTDDGNACTFDQCDGVGACVHPDNDFNPCDDGMFCDGSDFCFGGSCTFHDGNPCSVSECIAGCDEMAGQCDPTPPGMPCSNDGNVCTADLCDGAGGCVHPPAVGGIPCPDDGNACTRDQCDGAGSCFHPAGPGGIACPDDGNECTHDHCDGAGSCAHPAVSDGAVCDDSNACTQTDQCQSGHCAGSNPVVCPAPLCRQTGTCDPSTGTCTSCPTGYVVGGGGCQKTYAIDAGLLINQDSFCDGTGANRYNGCSTTPFGFHWTDTGDASVGAVLRVDVEIDAGLNCGAVDHTVALNLTPIGVYASTAAGSCACLPPAVPKLLPDVDPSSYVKSGSNAVSIDTTDCAGLSQDADGNYAIVTVTYQDPGLSLAPRTGCRQAAKSTFRYKNNANDALDKMKWKWGKGAATTQAEFGDPTASADYQLCIFGEMDSSPTLLIGANVPASATSWSAVGSTGYKYDDGAASQDGMKAILLRGGAAGKAKLLVNGQGAALGDPSLPLSLATTGIRAQLTNQSSGVCWESEFPLNRITADDQSIRATVR